MTLAALQDASGWLWPYLVMVLFGFLPNEIWRVSAMIAGAGLKLDSEVFIWVKFVAASLLAGVVAKLLIAPAGALAIISGQGRLCAIFAGLAAFFGFRRSVAAALIAGEAVLLTAGYLKL